MARRSKFLIWLLLGIPLAGMTCNYLYGTTLVFGEVYYGDYIHLTGRYAAWLLLLVLAARPLMLAAPGNRFARWYLGQRRYLGVASFLYAAAHLAAYLGKQDWARVSEDMALPDFWTGWIAFAIFSLLAMTSNNFSVRLLRRGWKALHRFVHVAAVLTFIHWALTAFDPLLAYCHIAILAALEVFRFGMVYRVQHRITA